MAQKTKKVSIPEPCHEDWDKMSVTDKGRFCGSCQKEVQDVSSFSDKKLLKFIEENENACVQMLPSQTDRNLVSETRSPLLSRAAVALGLISLTATGSALAQRKTMGAVAYVKEPVECTKDTVQERVLQGEIAIEEDGSKLVEVQFKGTVKNSSGNVLNEATITLINDQKFNTDKLGRFNFKAKVLKGEKIKLRVYKSGYQSEVLYVDPKSSKDIEIQLHRRMVKGKMKAH